jgi:putative hemolysin
MRGRMEGSLAVVQLGITLAGFVAAATGGAGSEEGLSPWIEQRFGLSEAWAQVIALTVFVVPLAALTIVVGELVPKLLALRDPLSVCLRLSPAMNVFAWIVHPAVVFFASAAAFVARRLSGGDTSPAAPGIAELRAQIQLLGVARQIGPEEERLLLAASHFSRVPVANVLVPVDAMVTLPLEARSKSASRRPWRTCTRAFPSRGRAGTSATSSVT